MLINQLIKKGHFDGDALGARIQTTGKTGGEDSATLITFIFHPGSSAASYVRAFPPADNSAFKASPVDTVSIRLNGDAEIEDLKKVLWKFLEVLES